MHFLKLVVVPAGIFSVNVMIYAIKKLKNLENNYTEEVNAMGRHFVYSNSFSAGCSCQAENNMPFTAFT